MSPEMHMCDCKFCAWCGEEEADEKSLRQIQLVRAARKVAAELPTLEGMDTPYALAVALSELGKAARK